MSAGKRDRYIAFQAATSTPSLSGEPVLTWGAYFSCWAERDDLQGSELFRAQQRFAKVTTRYVIPYPSGKSVTPRAELQIVDQGKTFDILNVAEKGNRGRVDLEIMAEARAE